MFTSELSKLKRFYLHRLQPHFASPPEVERAEQSFYLNYLREGMTVFDVGANIGELSLLFSRFVGSKGAVHAFEASQSAFENLSQVSRIARRPQIILNHAAVADKDGTLKLYVYDEDHSGWNSLANRPLEKYGIDIKPDHVESVTALSIDSYCERHMISHIDLLKIDVEGAEFQVLQGSRQMLENKRIRCCVFEFGQTTFDMGNNPDDIRKYLNKYGYCIKNIYSKDPIFPGGKSPETTKFSIHIARPN